MYPSFWSSGMGTPVSRPCPFWALLHPLGTGVPPPPTAADGTLLAVSRRTTFLYHICFTSEKLISSCLNSLGIRLHDVNFYYIPSGTAVLALLLAGYLAQKYLPPPPPKIVGIDLGK